MACGAATRRSRRTCGPRRALAAPSPRRRRAVAPRRLRRRPRPPAPWTHRLAAANLDLPPPPRPPPRQVFRYYFGLHQGLLLCISLLLCAAACTHQGLSPSIFAASQLSVVIVALGRHALHRLPDRRRAQRLAALVFLFTDAFVLCLRDRPVAKRPAAPAAAAAPPAAAAAPAQARRAPSGAAGCPSAAQGPASPARRER